MCVCLNIQNGTYGTYAKYGQNQHQGQRCGTELFFWIPHPQMIKVRKGHLNDLPQPILRE